MLAKRVKGGKKEGMNPLVLGSQSPYRKKLLARLGHPFIQVAPLVDEEALKRQSSHLNGIELCRNLAKAKALSLVPAYSDHLIIGSDQMALIDENGLEKRLDKPHRPEAAAEQLRWLSGKTHRLVSAVCLSYRDKLVQFENQTVLSMRALSEADIHSYINEDMPIDCAGSYKIELGGIRLFTEIQTSDFTAIEGLPLLQLNQEIRALMNLT